MSFRKKLILSALTASLVAACSKPLTEDEQLSLAQQNIEAGKIAEASINIKNVIKENPKNGQARFLLGKLYYQQEQFLAAEKELLKAVEVMPNDEQANLFLAKTFHSIDKHQQVIEILEGREFSSPDKQIEQYFLLGKSYLALENSTAAKENFTKISALKADAKESQLGQALLLAVANNNEEALAAIDEILSTHPSYDEAILLQASLYNKIEQFDKAANAYEIYHELKPNNFAVRLLIAYNYVRAGNIEAAKVHISELNKINDTHPTINLIDAQIRFVEQDYEKAKELADRVSNSTNNGLAAMISGLSSYYLNNFEQAYYQLNSIADDLPPAHQVHRVLALLQVKLGYVENFEQELLNDKSLTAEDVELLTAIGMESFYQGNNQAAEDLFMRAANLSPGDAKVKAQLGMIKITNQDQSGVEDLEQAISIDPKFKGANIALVVKHLNDKNFQAAAQVADNWIAKEPSNPEPIILRGNVALKEKNTALAKQYFTQALEIAPENTTALFNLAVLTSSEEKYEESNQYLDKIFALTLESKLAFQLAISNAIELKEEAALETKLKNIIERSPDAQWPRIVLARRLHLNGKTNEALDVIRGNTSFELLSDEYFMTFTNILIDAQRPQDAITVLNNWQMTQPKNRVSYLAKINFFEKNRDFNNALEVTQAALAQENFASDIEFLSYEAYFLLATSSIELAAKKVTFLIEKAPENALVQRVQGQVYLSQKQYALAQEYLGKSYEQRKHAATGINLAIALSENKGPEAAIAFLEGEIAQKIHTQSYTQYLAQLAINTAPPKAIESYKKLVAENPNDVVSLNNLAWLLADANQLEEALSYAQKSAMLAPSNPKVLDTLGTIYLKRKSLSESIKTLEKANELARGDMEITTHLAQAYQANNQQDKIDSLISLLTDENKQIILNQLKSK